MEDYSEEVKKVKTEENFNVYSFNAFRYVTKSLFTREKNSVVFMADINDLYISNHQYGKTRVNEAITEMLDQIKNIMISHGKKFEIGKLGDEIYVYLYECNENEIKDILEDFKHVQSLSLSLSVGYSRFFNSFGETIDTAEAMMSAYKKVYKSEVLKGVFGENIYKIIQHIINERFARSRFDLKEMDKSQVMQLRNILMENSDKLVIGRTEKEKSNRKSPEKLESERKEFNEEHQKHVAKFEDRSIKKFGCINEDYVLLKSVGIDVEKECVSDTYFRKVMLPKGKESSYKDKELIIMRMSGIKRVNDEYGHDICDKEVRIITEKMKQILKENKVIRTSPIIIRGAKEVYTFIKPSKNIDKVMKEINMLKDEEGKLLVYADNKKVDIKEGDTLQSSVENSVIDLVQNMEKEKYAAKIVSKYHIEHFLIAIRNKLLDNSVVKAKADVNPEIKAELFEYALEYLNILFNSRLAEFDENKKAPNAKNQDTIGDR